MKLDLQRLTATGAVALGYAAQALAQSPNKPMNIVYIMSDDHSYQTISAYDHRFIETPNIDWIAQNGARFTNSFVANWMPMSLNAASAISALYFPTQKTGMFNSKITNFKVE